VEKQHTYGLRGAMPPSPLLLLLLLLPLLLLRHGCSFFRCGSWCWYWWAVGEGRGARGEGDGQRVILESANPRAEVFIVRLLFALLLFLFSGFSRLSSHRGQSFLSCFPYMAIRHLPRCVQTFDWPNVRRKTYFVSVSFRHLFAMIY